MPGLSERIDTMQIETPPTEKRYEKPEGERRGIVIVNTGDGKGKSALRQEKKFPRSLLTCRRV